MLQLSLTHMQGGMQSASHMKRLPRTCQAQILRMLDCCCRKIPFWKMDNYD